jgi:hypothetical protein
MRARARRLQEIWPVAQDGNRKSPRRRLGRRRRVRRHGTGPIREGSGAQRLAAAGATGVQNLAPGFGCHPRAKAVTALAHEVRGLECPLRHGFAPYFTGPRAHPAHQGTRGISDKPAIYGLGRGMSTKERRSNRKFHRCASSSISAGENTAIPLAARASATTPRPGPSDPVEAPRIDEGRPAGRAPVGQQRPAAPGAPGLATVSRAAATKAGVTSAPCASRTHPVPRTIDAVCPSRSRPVSGASAALPPLGTEADQPPSASHRCNRSSIRSWPRHRSAPVCPTGRR